MESRRIKKKKDPELRFNMDVLQDKYGYVTGKKASQITFVSKIQAKATLNHLYL